MEEIKEYFRPYPTYEEVFYDDIENHKKHFLPICSVNLKFMFPERDEWVHFISVKEIYEGCVGENTPDFHTKYTKEDMLGFIIIDGKYKFESSWDYFIVNHDNNSEDMVEELEEVYDENTYSYEVGKKYFEKYGKIFNNTLNYENVSLNALEKMDSKYSDNKKEYPEYFGFIDDIKHQSKETKEMVEKYNISLKKIESFKNTNLPETPKDNDNKVFEYIGRLTGYKFQKYGADSLYVFQSQKMKKAVICLEYT